MQKKKKVNPHAEELNAAAPLYFPFCHLTYSFLIRANKLDYITGLHHSAEFRLLCPALTVRIGEYNTVKFGFRGSLVKFLSSLAAFHISLC